MVTLVYGSGNGCRRVGLIWCFPEFCKPADNGARDQHHKILYIKYFLMLTSRFNYMIISTRWRTKIVFSLEPLPLTILGQNSGIWKNNPMQFCFFVATFDKSQNFFSSCSTVGPSKVGYTLHADYRLQMWQNTTRTTPGIQYSVCHLPVRFPDPLADGSGLGDLSSQQQTGCKPQMQAKWNSTLIVFVISAKISTVPKWQPQKAPKKLVSTLQRWTRQKYLFNKSPVLEFYEI